MENKNEVKVLSKADDLIISVNKLEPEFKKALPSHITPSKFLRVVTTAIRNNNDILSADRQSFFNACMKAAQDGLIPDGREAAFVTFNTKAAGKIAQYMPMVNGILKKVRNSGELSTITANVVHEHDEFNYWVDENGEHLLHKPKLTSDRGDPVHAYAMAKTKDGSLYMEIMSYSEIEQVRQSSRAKDGGPWSQWWGEMAKKTVIRRLSKKLPMSTDLMQTIEADDEMYDFKQEENVDTTNQLKHQKKSSRLNAIIEAKGSVINEENKEESSEGKNQDGPTDSATTSGDADI